MNSLYPLIESIILDRVVGSQSPFTHKSKCVFGLFLLAATLALIAVVFVAIGTYLWLQITQPAHLAAFFTAGIILAGSFVSVIMAVSVVSYRKVRMKRVQKETQAIVAQLLEGSETQLKEFVESAPASSMALAVIAGFISGKFID
jgi:hypothetical protein|tara:strand:- start:39599 stop:40033 length:435 start_codon:yes stop_codon:yes gene_type:complete